jgi:hypothetical protein
MIYGAIAALPVLYGVMSFLFSGNYNNARISSKIFGKAFVSKVNSNSGHEFTTVKVSNGSPRQLLFKWGHINIKPGSVLRNPDGAIYEVHEDMGETLEPTFAEAGNTVSEFGFKTFNHALQFYKDEYFKADYDKVNERILASKTPEERVAAEYLKEQVERRVGLSLLKPKHPDDFTKALSILHNYSNNSRMIGVAMKNLKQSIELKVRSEQTKGLNQQTILTYGLALGMVILAVAFGLKIMGKV